VQGVAEDHPQRPDEDDADRRSVQQVRTGRRRHDQERHHQRRHLAERGRAHPDHLPGQQLRRSDAGQQHLDDAA
jgi:hypothetical protein